MKIDTMPPELGRQTINDRIAELIRELRMSQKDFSISIDKTGSAISTITGGRNKPSVAGKG